MMERTHVSFLIACTLTVTRLFANHYMNRVHTNIGRLKPEPGKEIRNAKVLEFGCVLGKSPDDFFLQPQMIFLQPFKPHASTKHLEARFSFSCAFDFAIYPVDENVNVAKPLLVSEVYLGKREFSNEIEIQKLVGKLMNNLVAAKD